MIDRAVSIRVREARREDQPFLALMMFYAAHMDEEGKELGATAVMELPAAAQYVTDWGRPCDLGFLALDSEEDLRVGAAWLRLYRSDARAFGYVDDVTPEVAIGVLPDYRGKGGRKSAATKAHERGSRESQFDFAEREGFESGGPPVREAWVRENRG